MSRVSHRFFLNSTNVLVGVRVIARVLTILIFLSIILMFLFGTSPGKIVLDPFALPHNEALMLISFYFALLGLLLAWISEGLGGFLTIAALLCFTILNYIGSGQILWNIWVMALPACLFIFYWWATNVSDNFNVYRE